MAIADSKKCQTLINVAAAKVLELQAVSAKLQALRTAFVAQAVDPAGTPLDGHVAQISAWIDAIDAVATDAVANGLLAAIVPSHRNKALGDI